MSTIHLITTCAKSKNGPVLDTIYPYSIQDNAVAYQNWKNCVLNRYSQGTDVKETGLIYRGAHWSTAMGIAKTHDNVVLWVVSAGLGLRHISDPSIPYEASFTMMGRNMTDMWERLITDPVLPGTISSLESLLQNYNKDTFIIAASPVYLNAIECDLMKGVHFLHDPSNQLTIATSCAYTGILNTYVRYGSRGMMKSLNSNMTTLNIKHAGSIISGILQDTKSPVLRITDA